MQYIIMAGGQYPGWKGKVPRHLTPIHGEPLVARTIRQLRDNGVSDIAISTNSMAFSGLGVPVLRHVNPFVSRSLTECDGQWCDAFYPTHAPVCYMFGDVVFTDRAVKTIVETPTDDIEFFASAPPFAPEYTKKWAEPFALKVVDTGHLFSSIDKVRLLDSRKAFNRPPIMWELWQVIKGTPINVIDYTNYVVINDATCDVDYLDDIAAIEDRMGGSR